MSKERGQGTPLPSPEPSFLQHTALTLLENPQARVFPTAQENAL